MKIFDTKEQAQEWMLQEVDDPCIDNLRFALIADTEAMERYEEYRAQGCCGSFDEMVMIGRNPAMIGCNYGH
jgi:hypothetical protein